ncbi:MAG: 30S ribosomal protein S8 [Bacilli bacterium]|nr:30S ribosomal protein S8 [Bacilli bacterium]
MGMTDPIADMLTRIRNANQNKSAEVIIPASKIKLEILNVLKNEGYINEVEFVEDGKQGSIKVTLKYTEKKERVIKGIKRISKPGLRVYASVTDMPKVLNGLGIAVVSTSKGVMTDREARKEHLGGEVLAYVW